MSVSRKTGEIYYTDEELQEALKHNNALSRGYDLVRCGSEYHLKEHDSMVFKRDGRWYWNSQGLHGHALDFIQAYENRSYQEAVCVLAGTIDRPVPVGLPREMPSQGEEERPEFILPEPSRNNRNLFAYLIKERGVDSDLVKRLVERHNIYQGMTYNKLKIAGYDEKGTAWYKVKERYREEFAKVPRVRESVCNSKKNGVFHMAECLSGDTLQQLLENGQIRIYQNLVMLGYGSDGSPHYASMRSMNSRGKPVKVDVPGSDKSYPFVLDGKPGGDTVCVFESPIEAMSYRTLCKITGSSRIACPMISQGGAAAQQALDRYLKGHSEIRSIVVGLNNDSKTFGHNINAGKNGTEKIRKNYEKQYQIIIHQPYLDDWNDVLKNYRRNLEGMLPEIRGPGRSPAISKSRQFGVAI